ncbi:hypothetical protein ACOMHN_023239 [Nucella lapillus]
MTLTTTPSCKDHTTPKKSERVAEARQNGPEAGSTESAKGPRQIHKQDTQVPTLPQTSLLQPTDSENHVHCYPTLSKSTLALRDDTTQEVCVVIQPRRTPARSPPATLRSETPL